MTKNEDVQIPSKWDVKSYEICLRNLSETGYKKLIVFNNLGGRKWILFHNCTSQSPAHLMKP